MCSAIGNYKSIGQRVGFSAGNFHPEGSHHQREELGNKTILIGWDLSRNNPVRKLLRQPFEMRGMYLAAFIIGQPSACFVLTIIDVDQTLVLNLEILLALADRLFFTDEEMPIPCIGSRRRQDSAQKGLICERGDFYIGAMSMQTYQKT